MARKEMTYEEACHAMQSGVAMELQLNSDGTGGGSTPKHLRVGVNSAMSDQGALAYLLINKGIITEEEYLEAVRIAMIAEVERYELRLSQLMAKTVTLG